MPNVWSLTDLAFGYMVIFAAANHFGGIACRHVQTAQDDTSLMLLPYSEELIGLTAVLG